MNTFTFILGLTLTLNSFARIYKHDDGSVEITKTEVKEGNIQEVLDENGNPISLLRFKRSNARVYRKDQHTTADNIYSEHKLQNLQATAILRSYQIQGSFIKIDMELTNSALPLSNLGIAQFETYALEDVRQPDGSLMQFDRRDEFKTFFDQMKDQEIQVSIQVKELIRYLEIPRAYISRTGYTTAGAYNTSHLGINLFFEGFSSTLSFYNDLNPSLDELRVLEESGLYHEIVEDKE